MLSLSVSREKAVFLEHFGFLFKSAVTQSYWFSRRRRGRVISRHNFCEWYMKDGVFPYSFISLILIQDVEGAKWVLIHFKFNYVLYNYITPGAFPARYKTKLNGYKYTSRTKRTKTNIILKHTWCKIFWCFLFLIHFNPFWRPLNIINAKKTAENCSWLVGSVVVWWCCNFL